MQPLSPPHRYFLISAGGGPGRYCPLSIRESTSAQASRVKDVSKVIVQAPRIQKVSQQSNSHSPHSLRVADLEEERPRRTQATPQLSRAAATASNRCFHAGAFELRPTGGRGGPVLNVHPFKLPQRLKSLHLHQSTQYTQTLSRMWRWTSFSGSSPAPLGARGRDAAADGRAAHLAATECSPSAAGIVAAFLSL